MSANYAIFIEDYVLSYLKREVDSLELSEIFFYGKRENGGRKFLVYGAGRSKEIAAFAGYELLDELVCRLTQAGPVFMVREKDGDYRTSSFRTFYADNEAMQNYLIEWTSGLGKDQEELKTDFHFKKAALAEPPETAAARAAFPEEGNGKSGSVISAQLGLILVVLVAIVISSANSYDKMERMNQSAREVFFAIENQEVGQSGGRGDTAYREDAQQENKTEILVERNTDTEDISVEDAVRAENAAQTEAAAGGQSGTDAAANQAESGGQSGTDGMDSSQTGADAAADKAAGSEQSGKDGQDGVSVQKADSSVGADSKQEKSAAGNEEPSVLEEDAEKGDSSEEALSRNITRYYEVERGDTLYTISQKIYGDASRVEKICELNKISNPDKISEGQKIILP